MDKRPFWKLHISEHFPEKFRLVLQDAEPCLAGRHAQCNSVLVQECAEGMCMDGRVPAGIFVSEGPVDQWERGSEPSRRLCFLGAEMSVGAQRIWSVGWEPAGVSAPGPRQWQRAQETTGRCCLQKLPENSPS